MGIFDFVKQAGQSIGEAAQQASEAAAGVIEKASIEAMKARIEQSDIETRDLALKWVDRDTVKIYAVVNSVEDKESLVLMIGNTAGVGRVEDAVKVRDAQGKEVAVTTTPRLYTVQRGDTLSGIAAAQLGSGERYQEIFAMNKHILTHPDAIDVGQTLRLPKS